jgi:hypothetical protein
MCVVAGLLAALVTAAAGAEPPAADPVPLRRFALVAGSNAGGPDRGKLKYAASDARAFASVLKELGGVREEDLVLLVDPSVSSFRSAMGRMQQKLVASPPGGERRELVVYYSGHSDEEGLILGADRFPYDTFRRDISAIPADVRVAILDSCASGALTRAKGGVSRPAFLFDATADMRGHAFLTSSSAEEAAQESDRIGASFFTHFLVSGLRGAADTTGDGLVTLNEAYAFAFQETLASTERTQFGAQHPAYDISLTGSGDLVLTDLRAASAGLTIPEGIAGRLSIRDERGLLAVELAKAAGQRVDLALPAGTYAVLLDDRGERTAAEVRIESGRRVTLAAAQLRPVTSDRTTARGDERFEAADLPGEEPPGSGGFEREGPREVEPFHLAFLPEFSFRTSRAVSVSLLIGSAAYSTRFAAAGIANLASRDVTGVQLAGVLNAAGGDAGFLQSSGVVSFCGGELAGLQASGVGSLALAGGRGAQVSGVFAIAGGPFQGAQVSGVANWAHDGIRGAQVSGAFNFADTMAGPQISVVNIAGTVTGAQVGVVNIADSVTGTQVGVVNISRRMDGVPVGLITVAGNGRKQLQYWTDTDGSQNAGFALGAGPFYTLFMGSWVPDTERWAWGVGLGAGLEAGRLLVEADASMLSVHDSFAGWASAGPGTLVPFLRAQLGVKVFGRVAASAGLGLRVYVPGMSPSPDASPLTEVRAVPSFLFGVRI